MFQRQRHISLPCAKARREEDVRLRIPMKAFSHVLAQHEVAAVQTLAKVARQCADAKRGAEEDVGDARTTDPTMILTLLFSSHVCRACRHEAGIGPWTAHDVEAGSRASCLQHFRQHAVLEALGLQILVNRALGDFQQLKFALHPGYVRLQ